MSAIGLQKFGFDPEIEPGEVGEGAVSRFLSMWIESEAPKPLLVHDLTVTAPHATPVTLQTKVRLLPQPKLAGGLLHWCFPPT